MEKLKRCPFCGGKAIIFKIPPTDDLPDNLWVIGCDGAKGSLCPCYVWKISPFYIGEKLAIKMWNERSE